MVIRFQNLNGSDTKYRAVDDKFLDTCLSDAHTAVRASRRDQSTPQHARNPLTRAATAARRPAVGSPSRGGAAAAVVRRSRLPPPPPP